ncbi:MAG: integration host factor subunit beta [Gammaproteobacteria bacterium]|nr:integration host factor subunit beta [Gammaproteobacteria bacterium]
MVKSELIGLIASRLSHFSERQVALIVSHILEAMSETLMDGRRIEIRGFGSFSVHTHAPRVAHNPKTGEKVVTKEKRVPHFKMGKPLRERLNQDK